MTSVRSTRVTDEPCIVLHTRAYRESSLLVSVLSLNHGRVAMVARGVRGGRRGRALQPFTALRAGWTGRSSLATLTGFEAIRQHWFQGDALACAFYLTELLNRLLGERESHPRLYAGLDWALETLERDPVLALRSFEKLLLEELGYGLDFQLDVDGRPIEDGVRYRLIADKGFIRSEEGYSGSVLLLIGREDFAEGKVRSSARALFREALSAHLGPRPLLSRRMLVSGS